MSDEPLTNAAVEWMRRGFAFMSAAGAPPAEFPDVISADFVYEARNRRGVNFGEIAAEGWPAFMASIWEVGTGRPSWSMSGVLAVRGERCAAVTSSIEYGDDRETGSTFCFRLDAELLRLQRIVDFDVDDRDAAIAELDRMHAEIDD